MTLGGASCPGLFVVLGLSCAMLEAEQLSQEGTIMARLYSINDAPKTRGVKAGAPVGRMAAQKQVAGRIAKLYKSRSGGT